MQILEFHFYMGCYRASIPTDRRYAKNHMWAAAAGDSWRFGFTAYAERLMLDVYLLDWIVDAGTDLAEQQEIGQIESKKAESSLYCPIAGQLVRFNAELLKAPAAINNDTYGAGWLFEMTCAGENLLSPEAYVEYLDDIWEATKQALMGQMNKRDPGM